MPFVPERQPLNRRLAFLLFLLMLASGLYGEFLRRSPGPILVAAGRR